MKRVLFLLFVITACSLRAQTLDEMIASGFQNRQFPPALAPPNALTTPVVGKGVRFEDSRDLVEFYIPTAILAFGIEPASISKATVNVTDTKFTLKYGFQLNNKGNKLKSGLGVALSSKLSDGIRTLFTPDEVPKDFSGSVIYTHTLKDQLFVRSNADHRYTSNAAQWLNVSVTGGVTQRYVFTADTIYAKHNDFDGQLMVSFSNLFNSLLTKKWLLRNILNIGVGYGFFNNYESLDDYTLRRGVLNAGNSYFGESKSIVGKRGSYQKLDGFIASGSAFIPLTKSIQLTSVFAGVNANFFSPGTNNYSNNINAGFYISRRSIGEKKKLEEDFSFGVVAVWDQFQKRDEAGYSKDHFSVRLTAQIPIGFK